jgi:hypothetical protein
MGGFGSLSGFGFLSLSGSLLSRSGTHSDRFRSCAFWGEQLMCFPQQLQEVLRHVCIPKERSNASSATSCANSSSNRQAPCIGQVLVVY